MKTITFDLISYVSIQNRQINLRKKAFQNEQNNIWDGMWWVQLCNHMHCWGKATSVF